MLMNNWAMNYSGENGSGGGGGNGGDDGAPAGDVGADTTQADGGADTTAADAAKVAADKVTADAAAADKAAADGAYVDDPAKTAEENKTAKEAHDAAAAEKAELFGAPEKYADLVIPEGMALDQTAADALFEYGKKAGLSQKAIDGIVGIQVDLNTRAQEAATKEWTETVKTWDKTAKADKEIGGAEYDANMGKAAAARDTFGSAEFNAWLDDTQLGSHPEMRRFLVRVGKAMGEGSAMPGGKVNTTESAAEILYDNPTSRQTK